MQRRGDGRQVVGQHQGRAQGARRKRAAAMPQALDRLQHLVRHFELAQHAAADQLFAVFEPVFGIAVEQARIFLGARQQIKAAHFMHDGGKHGRFRVDMGDLLGQHLAQRGHMGRVLP